MALCLVQRRWQLPHAPPGYCGETTHARTHARTHAADTRSVTCAANAQQAVYLLQTLHSWCGDAGLAYCTVNSTEEAAAVRRATGAVDGSASTAAVDADEFFTTQLLLAVVVCVILFVVGRGGCRL